MNYNGILKIIRVLEKLISETPRTAVPARWGLFHCVFLSLFALLIALMAVCRRKLPRGDRAVRIILAAAGLFFVFMEAGKQILCSYDPQSGLWEYDFLRFPFQFCSLPIWLCPIGALCGSAGRGRICSFLASFGLFAGGAVLIWPSGGVFSEIAFLNWHTMLWHGLMVTVGFYLWFSETVRPSAGNVLGALAVYLPQCPIAALLNEAAHRMGIPMDLFHFSPYFRTDTPLLSLVQQAGANGFVMMISFMAVFGLLGLSVFAAAVPARALIQKCDTRKRREDDRKKGMTGMK